MGCGAARRKADQKIEPRADVDADDVPGWEETRLRVWVEHRRCEWASADRTRGRVARIQRTHCAVRRGRANGGGADELGRSALGREEDCAPRSQCVRPGIGKES